MYTSFADLFNKNPLPANVTAEAPETKPVPVVLENLSVTDENGQQCCPNCRAPFMGLGPTCYSC